METDLRESFGARGNEFDVPQTLLQRRRSACNGVVKISEEVNLSTAILSKRFEDEALPRSCEETLRAVITAFRVAMRLSQSIYTILDKEIKTEGVESFPEEEATSIVLDPLIKGSHLVDSMPSTLNEPSPTGRLSDHSNLATHSRMSPSSPWITTAHQINQQNQLQNIEVQWSVAKLRNLALPIMSLVLEMTSFILDIIWERQRTFILVAFLLSVIGLVMSLRIIYCCIMRRTRGRSTHRPANQRKELIEILEIVFSVCQTIVSLVNLILVYLHAKKGPIPSLIPLAFAVIVVILFIIDNSPSRVVRTLVD